METAIPYMEVKQNFKLKYPENYDMLWNFVSDYNSPKAIYSSIKSDILYFWPNYQLGFFKKSDCSKKPNNNFDWFVIILSNSNNIFDLANVGSKINPLLLK